MANERLADLTQADMLEIASRDPRVQLMERLYSAPEAQADLEGLVRKHAKLFPNAKLPPDIHGIAREAAATAIADDLKAIKELRAETEKERKDQRHAAFRAQMIEAGAVETDVEKIEQFMLDNEIGPKSVALAVERYYEVTAPAEPNVVTSGLAAWEPQNVDQSFMKTLVDAPIDADLDQIAAPWYEKTFQDMTRPQRGRNPRAFA